MSPPLGYRARNPRATALYQAVKNHRHAAFAPFTDTRLPAYVDRHLDAYLRCGILDYGFLRLRCDACRQDLLVAFSCKKRGVCPSCSARRASDTAIHLTDHVLPRVPYRQWVFTLPYRLRFLLSRDPRRLTAVQGACIRALFAHARKKAHGRRKFFEALPTNPEPAQHAIDLIRELYEVELEAAEGEYLGGEWHAALRRTKSAPIVKALMNWARDELPKHRPKSPIGKAIGYLLNQRKSLELFLKDPKIRLDNTTSEGFRSEVDASPRSRNPSGEAAERSGVNIAEQYLRLIALGRKNFLFVGHDAAGHSLAILQTLISTCIANGVNPQAYLADVILRIQHHPQSEIDALLPWNWRAPPKTD